MIKDRVPTHTITSRPATDSERARINQEARPVVPSYGCLILFFGIVPAVGLGWLGARLGSRIGPGAAQWGRFIGVIIGALTLIIALSSYIRFERRMRARARRDVETQAVEELFVSNPRVIQISL